MTACPVHEKECVSACSQCGDALRLYRPALLECHCGASLAGSTTNAISNSHRDLLEIVRRTILRIEHQQDCISGLPVRELARLDPRQLLSLIRILGRDTGAKNVAPTHQELAVIVRRASELLSNWPTRFFGSLSEIAALPTAQTSFARGAFGSLYSSIFKSKVLAKENVQFLRVALADFASSQWAKNPFRSTTPSFSEATQSSRANRRQFAQQLGIHIKTLDRMIAQGEVPSETITVGVKELTVCVPSATTLAPVTPGKVLRIRTAAAEVGISVNILGILKMDGDFISNHYPRTKPGFHELDIRDFINSVTRDVERASHQAKNSITFRTALQRLKRDRSWQLHFVRAVLNREIQIMAQSGNNLSTLLIAQDEYIRYIEGRIAISYGITLDYVRAAQYLHCDRRTILPLVRAKCLLAHDTPIGVRISRESLADFSSEYSALCDLANQHGTSTRALLKKCFSININLLHMGKDRQQAFVRRSDLDRLLINSTLRGSA